MKLAAEGAQVQGLQRQQAAAEAQVRVLEQQLRKELRKERGDAEVKCLIALVLRRRWRSKKRRCETSEYRMQGSQQGVT